ncbi:MAG TPA: arginine--tRNA ligase [Desulfomonilia bacterium]
MKHKVEAVLNEVLNKILIEGEITIPEGFKSGISVPADKQFGDYATNAAMMLAKPAKKNPRELAALISKKIQDSSDLFTKVEVAGPGFINFFVKVDAWAEILEEVITQKVLFGRSSIGAKKKVQIEFVSANPTGPLHVGHGRGAAVGDTLARILDAAGFDVQREYYINDTGNQMNMLGLSVYSRYRELLGHTSDFPENGYKGGYIKEIASEIHGIHGESLLYMPEKDAVAICREYAGKNILEGINRDLREFNINFDVWFSESELYKDDMVGKTLESMKAKGLTFEEDNALWFRSTEFGDEKDRVLRKSDGALTYFAPDIAYHKNKLERGFEKIIDIWGADHHGYVPRMSAAMKALGAEDDCFHALLIQLVSLVRAGVPVQMSTRSGEFVTLKEVVDEVGRDAARFFFMMRRCDSHLVFDLELAKKKGEENPVFYVQYAHARICSIIRKAALSEQKPETGLKYLKKLITDDEIDLMKMIAQFPDTVLSAATELEPHRIAYYVLELATAFHRFYNKNKVIGEDYEVSAARLLLVDCVRQVIANGLSLMGVDAPDSM